MIQKSSSAKGCRAPTRRREVDGQPLSPTKVSDAEVVGACDNLIELRAHRASGHEKGSLLPSAAISYGAWSRFLEDLKPL